MIDLNFTIPPSRRSYDAMVALKSFESAGDTKSVAAGQTIFVENEKGNPFLLRRDKMYFLLEGEVDLTVNKNHVGVVHKGEIFGEMTLITKMPRTATATAKTDCRLITLDKNQLQAALQAAPEFGLLLMRIMITRLRDTIPRLSENGELSSDEVLKDSTVFDRSVLDRLVEEFDASSRIRFPADKVIMQEGQTGMFMYVVLQGKVEISIQNNIVGRIGPGGIFGEMALITQSERVASAVAKTDCVLLAINRNVFLGLVSANPKFAISLLSAVGNRARFMASQRA
jgi:CRP-like cAMP-binding protein